MDESTKLAQTAHFTFRGRRARATNSKSVFYSRFSGENQWNEIDVHENQSAVWRWLADGAKQTTFLCPHRKMPNGNLEFDTLFITFPVDIKESFEFLKLFFFALFLVGVFHCLFISVYEKREREKRQRTEEAVVLAEAKAAKKKNQRDVWTKKVLGESNFEAIQEQ